MCRSGFLLATALLPLPSPYHYHPSHHPRKKYIGLKLGHLGFVVNLCSLLVISVLEIVIIMGLFGLFDIPDLMSEINKPAHYHHCFSKIIRTIFPFSAVFVLVLHIPSRDQGQPTKVKEHYRVDAVSSTTINY